MGVDRTSHVTAPESGSHSQPIHKRLWVPFSFRQMCCNSSEHISPYRWFSSAVQTQKKLPVVIAVAHDKHKFTWVYRLLRWPLCRKFYCKEEWPVVFSLFSQNPHKKTWMCCSWCVCVLDHCCSLFACIWILFFLLYHSHFIRVKFLWSTSSEFILFINFF